MELAIDTSTDQASVALALEGRLLSEVTWHASPAGGQGSRRHSATLLPALQKLFIVHRPIFIGHFRTK